jgi:hypothetical protein
MSAPRLAAALMAVSLSALGAPLPSRGQPAGVPDTKPGAFEVIQTLLDESLVEAALFREAMPLARFLDALERHLPEGKKVPLRIDREAFGDRAGDVAAAPVLLPAAPKKTTLRRALEAALAKLPVAADYALAASAVAITTPERALHTVVYDIRDLVMETRRVLAPATATDGPRALGADPVRAAARVVQMIVSTLEVPRGKRAAPAPPAIEILNGTRLVIRTTPARHAEIADLLAALRRLADLAVVLKADLYEVDDAFYQKLRTARRVPLEEQERRLVDGLPAADGALWKLLEKQAVVLAGEEVKADDGVRVPVLSRHRAAVCLPSPEQLRKGEKGLQTILEGVSFHGEIQVSPDRRSVRVKLTERATEIQELRKVELWAPGLRGDQLPPAPPEGKVEAEIPFLKESTTAQLLEIPDGGSVLVPVGFRPPATQAKGRWWVLSVTARIHIEEEERQIRLGSLGDILPAVVADVLTNPRLKPLRDLYGTPGDKRFALLNGDVWAWAAPLKAEVPGHQQAAAARAGKRLLGIRVEDYREAAKGATGLNVTLVNAGGSANGAAVGGCTIRYTARPRDGGWVVELSDAPAP